MSELIKRYELEKLFKITFVSIFIIMLLIPFINYNEKIEINENTYEKIYHMKLSLDKSKNRYILENGDAEKIPVSTINDFNSIRIYTDIVDFTLKEIDDILNLINTSMKDNMISVSEGKIIINKIMKKVDESEDEREIEERKKYCFEKEQKIKEIKENLKKVEKNNE